MRNIKSYSICIYCEVLALSLYIYIILYMTHIGLVSGIVHFNLTSTLVVQTVLVVNQQTVSPFNLHKPQSSCVNLLSTSHNYSTLAFPFYSLLNAYLTNKLQ